MIITELYNGQGLGNQLWCYVTLRVLAQDRGFEFGIQSPERFKGMDFLDLDFGKQVFGGKGPEGGPPEELPRGITHYYLERSIKHPDGSDIRTFDEGLLGIPDGTKIDGLLQDGAYIAKRLPEIKEWLRVRPEYECLDYASDDICVINFRGGGYVLDREFFLPKTYWQNAIAHMKGINPRFRFIVVTDDTKTAQKFFPDFEVFHWNIAKDYVVIKNAHYLILSNSSFAQFPALTSDRLKKCVAPKYWARHNTSDGYWSLGYNITPDWEYLDRDGKIFDSTTCQREFDAYMEKNKERFTSKVPSNASQAYVPTAKSANKEKTHNKLRATLSKARIKLRSILGQVAMSPFIEPFVLRLAERKVKRGWLSPEEIVQKRKETHVYDVFTFFNELDLLEIRLNILDPYVDKFVLIEASKTFSGHSKPLHYQENKERFKKWNRKIIHYAVLDAPESEEELRGRLHRGGLSVQERLTIKFALQSHTVGLDTPHWFREFYIKESARKALEGLRDEDFCYVSDLDEIWNPELLIDVTKDNIFKPLQKTYAYFLNNRTGEHWKGWTGTIATKYKNIRGACLNHLRTHRIMQKRYSFLLDGGWHFTFQGGYEGAKRKIEESKHFWYEPEKTLPDLWSRIKSNRDFRGRKIRLWKDERGLPKFLIENKEKYKRFFK